MRVIENREFKLIWNIASGLSYPHASDLWESATWQYLIDSGEDIYGKRPVKDYLERPRFELFNIADDPCETKNLAEDLSYAGVLSELKERIREFQETTGDPWIVKWTHE